MPFSWSADGLQALNMPKKQAMLPAHASWRMQDTACCTLRICSTLPCALLILGSTSKPQSVLQHVHASSVSRISDQHWLTACHLQPPDFLWWDAGYGPGLLQDGDVMALARLTSLTHLDLSDQADVTDVGFAALAALPQLQASHLPLHETSCRHCHRHHVAHV